MQAIASKQSTGMSKVKKSKKTTNELPHNVLLSQKWWKKIVYPFFWLATGFLLSGTLLISVMLIYVRESYKDRVYQGVFIDNLYMGGKTKQEVEELFAAKNRRIEKTTFIFTHDSLSASSSAQDLSIGYNPSLLSEQAFLIGKSGNPFSDISMVVSASFNGIMLKSSYSYSQEKLSSLLAPIQNNVFQEPLDALFTVENNRVIAFQESRNGKTIDFETLDTHLRDEIKKLAVSNSPQVISLPLPIKTLKPKITTEQTNSLGIVEIIGEGKSYFSGSIPNRIHNITLAASRINGILIPPNEAFSFNTALGDVSKYTGYKEAYVIKNGKTILGDGGGVCQVSTTLFRAILNSGLPILERHPHSYRVGYYEQNSPVGLDATVFSPSVDFRFKNDTENYLLIQAVVDQANSSLTFTLYGKKDGREVVVTTPVKTNEIPPPEPLYQDDPNLAKGTTKQIEYAAWGATVSFKRTVKKNGQVVFEDTFSSRYTPWQAVYLRGTKE